MSALGSATVEIIGLPSYFRASSELHAMKSVFQVKKLSGTKRLVHRGALSSWWNVKRTADGSEKSWRSGDDCRQSSRLHKEVCLTLMSWLKLHNVPDMHQ